MNTRNVLIGLALAAAVVALVFGVRALSSSDEERGGGTEVVDDASPVVDGPRDTRPSIPDAGADTLVDEVAVPAGANSAGAGAPGAATPGAGAGARETAGGADPTPGRADAATDELLRRTAAAYEGLRSLRADFTQTLENPLLRQKTTSSGTLFQRRPDRFLMRFSDPAGDVIVSDGSSLWVYYPSIDAKQVIRRRGAGGNAGAIDLHAQFIGDPVARFRAERHGTESVGGRPAQVVTLTPRAPQGYRSLKVWIDERDHLIRRFEIREETGAVRHFTLSSFTANPSLADGLFTFTPPAGAQVIER